jgi:CRISPR-associated endonuclease/helicase Cas3
MAAGVSPAGQEPSMVYAHSLIGRPEAEWEPLEEHLARVAELAALFASAFGAREWGRLAGLWHDLGKYQAKFQERLRGSAESVEHAGAGAALAVSINKARGLPLAFVIAGHHAGLANLSSSEDGGRLPLTVRLRENSAPLAAIRSALPPDLVAPDLPELPADLAAAAGDPGRLRSFELWVRFLFSALVDADFLATEAFYSPGLRAAALAGRDDIPALRRRLDGWLDDFVARLPAEHKRSNVNLRRAEVLAACREAAERAPGQCSLTVPTGGGKTLAALAFALRHAERHRLCRVIVAIPFTSIIEQTAEVYRRALGPANVLEHHSALDPQKEEEQNREAEIRRRLAAENWDAPVVVTTNVQLFESLFGASPSRCRKLHNLARSVILLDEAQTLPGELLLPILEGLRELTTRFGCTVVLTTATQPALARRDSLPQGLAGVREIIPAPDALADQLRRVEVRWPGPGEPPVPYPELAGRLAAHDQVLAVVHRRVDARVLAELLPAEHRFHLSALMCPAHRSVELAAIRARLHDRQPCRLVSTQLIEAGVDVDFPVVYRALGGLDSLAQAAGRCNREGRLPHPGEVVFFRAETSPPPGTPAKGLAIVEAMLRQGDLPLDRRASFETFFRQLYLATDLDIHGIQPLRETLSFQSVAARMRLIADGATPIVVPYGEAPERLEQIRRLGPDRLRLRGLQSFIVNLFDRDVALLQSAGALAEITAGVLTLSPAFHSLYHPRFGLVLDPPLRPDPAALIV